VTGFLRIQILSKQLTARRTNGASSGVVGNFYDEHLGLPRGIAATGRPVEIAVTVPSLTAAAAIPNASTLPEAVMLPVEVTVTGARPPPS
jgi:hypothetical protein